MPQTSSPGPAEQRRPAGAQRFLSFTDAIVAIAATLLVLPLVDVVTSYDPNDGVGPLLRQHAGLIFAFVLSFLVIYRFWGAHHTIFHEDTPLTGALRWLNCLWLLSIVFLPVPTRLVGTHSSSRSADGLYIATMLVAVVATAACQLLIARAQRRLNRAAVRSSLVMPTAMAAALVLAVTVPGVGLWGLLLLIPAGTVQNRLLHITTTAD